ncbi:MAG: RES domain-containing protein, partial [Alphaproteobacteria bacterium]
VPLRGRHFTYHWNGHQVDYIKDLTSRDVFAVEL